jgi:uncharacterized protein YdeI (YjbR/CyaY-like superfamily)
MKPLFFKTPNDFRQWLSKNHDKETELLVGFHKKGTGKPSITWPESVEQALCFGWIDGVRRSFNEDSYTIRFTPRKATSTWSAININKIEELIAKNIVNEAGMSAYAKRKESNSKIYSYEREEDAELPKAMERIFKANKPAWEFFIKQPPYYRKIMLHHIVSAKQDKTKQSRFDALVKACAEGKRLR